MTIYYPWHHLAGTTLRVHKALNEAASDYLICILPNGELIGIPCWMTNPEWQTATIGPPQVSVDALAELRSFLDGQFSGQRTAKDDAPIVRSGTDTKAATASRGNLRKRRPNT